MNNSRPDLNLLVVFDAVATSRSVSLAAKRLSLSQPAISHALNRLRDQLGDPLFLRRKAGFLPTPRAEAMIGPVRDILSAAGMVLSARQFNAETSERRFRVGASDYASLTLVPSLVKAFRSRARRAALDVLSVGNLTLEQIEAGEIDCTFWGANAPGPPWRSSALFSERLLGMVAHSHPLATKASNQSVTLDEYLAYPHIVVSLRDSRPNPVDAALAAIGRSRNVGVITQSFAANMASLTGSDLIASLPSRLAPIARGQGIMTFDLPLKLTDYNYSLVWHSRADADPAMAWFRQLIEQIGTSAI
jgi:DNA-binding transcriptional LysR family regulator